MKPSVDVKIVSHIACAFGNDSGSKCDLLAQLQYFVMFYSRSFGYESGSRAAEYQPIRTCKHAQQNLND